MAFTRFSDIAAEFVHVDEVDVLSRIDSSPALRVALEMSRPRNWWGCGIDPECLRTMSENDGIPVAWVPPSNVLVELVDGHDRTARIGILNTHKAVIIEQCVELLGECDDPWLADDTALISRAVAAYAGGFHEAAMALAVSVGEPLATWASTPRVHAFKDRTEEANWETSRKGSKYKWASTELAAIGTDISAYRFLESVLIAPIPKFFTPWYPEAGSPPPVELSRHVVAHQATRAHFSQENTLISLMLVVSILRAQQAWCQEVRMMDAPNLGEVDDL